jgi:hypothetical protein
MKQACCCQAQFAASANRGFEFDKRGQFFIGTHNVCGGSQIVAELKEFPVRRTKTSPLPTR